MGDSADEKHDAPQPSEEPKARDLSSLSTGSRYYVVPRSGLWRSSNEVVVLCELHGDIILLHFETAYEFDAGPDYDEGLANDACDFCSGDFTLQVLRPGERELWFQICIIVAVVGVIVGNLLEEGLLSRLFGS